MTRFQPDTSPEVKIASDPLLESLQKLRTDCYIVSNTKIISKPEATPLPLGIKVTDLSSIFRGDNSSSLTITTLHRAGRPQQKVNVELYPWVIATKSSAGEIPKAPIEHPGLLGPKIASVGNSLYLFTARLVKDGIDKRHELQVMDITPMLDAGVDPVRLADLILTSQLEDYSPEELKLDMEVILEVMRPKLVEMIVRKQKEPILLSINNPKGQIAAGLGRVRMTKVEHGYPVVFDPQEDPRDTDSKGLIIGYKIPNSIDQSPNTNAELLVVNSDGINRTIFQFTDESSGFAAEKAFTAVNIEPLNRFAEFLEIHEGKDARVYDSAALASALGILEAIAKYDFKSSLLDQLNAGLEDTVRKEILNYCVSLLKAKFGDIPALGSFLQKPTSTPQP